jgi:hypothetical protein
VARTLVWVLRLLWLLLPLTAGFAADATLDGTSTPVHLVAAAGLWGLWVVGLVAGLVPTTVALTVLRLLAPAPAVLGVIALVDDPGGTSLVATLAGVVLAVVAFHPHVGRAFVQGSAYGDEARFPLRPPGQLVLGPLPVLWVALAASAAGGPLLLATRQWAVGAVVSAVAVGLLVVLPRRFHLLSRRFLVFVPAGLALHDQLVLGETAMFRWREVRSFSRALATTEALDLTGGSLGAAVEVSLRSPETVVRRGRRPGESSAVRTEAFLCRPTLLGEAVAEAERRHRHG